MWWRIPFVLLVAVFLRVVVVGRPVDRYFLAGLLGAGIGGLLVFLALPVLDRLCSAEDRMWASLWRRLRGHHDRHPSV